ncbi:MAG TPA: hypothetical protein VL853_00300 [Gemmatimonadales bacterium]|nr:hypothetical protein [Gemmatimonadales bacterium]
MAIRHFLPGLAALVLACGPARKQDMTDPLTPIGTAYVRLALAVGAHDPDYVDAFYGPAEWKTAADSAKLPIGEIRTRAAALLDSLRVVKLPDTTELVRLRQSYLTRQLESMAARLDMLEGTRLSFDEESRALYGVAAPTGDEEHFQMVIRRLDSLLPGTGPIAARYTAWRRGFIVPTPRLDTVFKAAIAACRERTLAHMTLPPGESFTLEYVTGKPWTGYNWYKGNFQSLIQVNTDVPVFIDRALDVACHEGYPGHHTYNMLLERELVRGRGWPEYQVYPLFSPQSLIAEGSANYGIDIAFTEAERLAFEREVLFPLAGLDPSLAERYAAVQDIAREVSYAVNDAAREYVEGRIDAKKAAEWLERYALMSPEQAAQRVRFMDRYRSYVINYNFGRDLVGGYIDRETGAGASQDARWKMFSSLLASPRLPQDLFPSTEQ